MSSMSTPITSQPVARRPSDQPPLPHAKSRANGFTSHPLPHGRPWRAPRNSPSLLAPSPRRRDDRPWPHSRPANQNNISPIFPHPSSPPPAQPGGRVGGLV